MEFLILLSIMTPMIVPLLIVGAIIRAVSRSKRPAMPPIMPANAQPGHSNAGMHNTGANFHRPKKYESKAERVFKVLWRIFAFIVIISMLARLVTFGVGEFIDISDDAFIFNWGAIFDFLRIYLLPLIVLTVSHIIMVSIPRIRSAQDRKYRRQYSKYFDILRNRVSMPLSEISSITGKPENQVKADLKFIIEKDLLPTAYIDHGKREIVLSNVVNQATVNYVIHCCSCGGRYTTNEKVSDCIYCRMPNSI